MKHSHRVIADFLEEVRIKHGFLTTKAVLLAARSKHCPVHDYFEWDDTEAAEQYRLWQAQHLIASVTVIEGDGREHSAYFNVRVATDDEDVPSQYYERAAVVARNPSMLEWCMGQFRLTIRQARENLAALERLKLDRSTSTKIKRISKNLGGIEHDMGVSQ